MICFLVDCNSNDTFFKGCAPVFLLALANYPVYEQEHRKDPWTDRQTKKKYASSAQLGRFPARVTPGLRANGQDDAQFIDLGHEFLTVRRDRTINVIGMRLGVQ